jgi:hypothetical protein
VDLNPHAMKATARHSLNGGSNTARSDATCAYRAHLFGGQRTGVM